MRSHLQDLDKGKSEAEVQEQLRHQSLEFRLSSKIHVPLTKLVKLPSIPPHITPQLTSRTDKNKSLITFTKLPNHTQLEKLMLEQTLILPDFSLQRPSRHSANHSLGSFRENSNGKYPKKMMKPKVKKVFPQLEETQMQDQINKISNGKYRVVSKIGQGAYAKVFKIVNGSDKYGVKVYQKSKMSHSNQSSTNIQREISALKALTHPNIIGFVESFQTSTSINIVTEYFHGKTLFSFLKSTPKKLQLQHVKVIFKQIVGAVQYIHKRGICHRDIKMENILIDQSLTIKLIDFGFAIQTTSQHTQTCGTLSYMAPEIILKKPYSGQSIDIWACGIILYRLLVGDLPFKGGSEKSISDKIVAGRYRADQEIDAEGESLIQKMLVVAPCLRISARQASKHSFFR